MVDLVEQARLGDEAAFEKLVVQHAPGVYHTVLRLLGKPEDAEEILQETFLQAHRKLHTLSDPSRFKGWLYRIASNLALMRLRKRGYKLEVLTEEPLVPKGHMPRKWSIDPEARIEEEELQRVLVEALERLDPIYRVAFWMKDVEGLTNQEVADALGLSLPATKSRVLRARLRLRDLLSEYFEREKSA